MGPSPTAAKLFQKIGADVNDYFPDRVTIHVGDSVRFLPAGFHTVNIPARRGPKGPLPFLGATGPKIAGALDAAGQPFWFNGQPGVAVNPVIGGAAGLGKRFVYTGKKRVESGVPGPGGPPKPMTVKFTTKGTLTYYCDVHPGMKATIVVRPKRRSIPTARQAAKALKRQYAKDLKVAKGLTATKPPAGTVDLGSAGADGVEVFAMFPGTVTVPVGTTLKFQMSKRTYETHTATFGPGPADTPSTYLGKLAASFQSPAPDPAAVYPSDMPPAPATLTPALHGNGFWSSGALDVDKASPPPAANAVTFGAPGTYTYYCLIHPFMKGTVIVQ
jgi:plastocyanin